MISLVLADDNAAMLENLTEELGAEFKILGSARNGFDALREVIRLEPDVLILDITMPFMSGLHVAERLRDTGSQTKTIFLTIHEEPEYIAAGLEAGALGYVTKRRFSNDLPTAIREVFAGRTFLSPTLRR
jgi:two-component system, NarL family, response regulator DegU